MSDDADVQRDLILERRVSATPAQLFAGWTQPDLLLRWFAPRPWQVVACELDPRPGGVFATVMQSGDGVRMPESRGCFLDAQAPNRLVWTNMLREDFVPNALAPDDFGFVCALTFTAVGEETVYRAHVRHVDAEGKQKHEAMGFEAGWSAALDQLLELIQTT